MSRYYPLSRLRERAGVRVFCTLAPHPATLTPTLSRARERGQDESLA